MEAKPHTPSMFFRVDNRPAAEGRELLGFARRANEQKRVVRREVVELDVAQVAPLAFVGPVDSRTGAGAALK